MIAAALDTQHSTKRVAKQWAPAALDGRHSFVAHVPVTKEKTPGGSSVERERGVSDRAQLLLILLLRPQG